MQNKPRLSLKKRFPKLLRNTVAAIAAACVALTVTGAVIRGVSDNRYYDEDRKRQTELEAIVNQLEYSGLTDEAKEAMRVYAERYSVYSNFVVVDQSFRVLYSLNQGYLDDSGYFYAVLLSDDMYGSGAFICDAQGNILSRHGFNGDTAGFSRLSRNFSKYPALTSSREDTGENGLRYASPLTMGDSSAMFYAGIASKGMNLFYMYDYQDQYTWRERYSNQVGNVLLALALFAFLAYWILLPVWVFIDAARRDNHPALWGILTLFTNAVGLIVYLVVRPEKPACKSCGEQLSAGFVVCPICGTRNKDQCCACGRVVEELWLWCPYCGKELNRCEDMELDRASGQPDEA